MRRQVARIVEYLHGTFEDILQKGLPFFVVEYCAPDARQLHHYWETL